MADKPTSYVYYYTEPAPDGGRPIVRRILGILSDKTLDNRSQPVSRSPT